MFGSEAKTLNVTRISVYAAHEPDGTFVKNMKHYNQTTAPVYSIHSLKVPKVLFHGGDDWLADPTDIQFILDEISKATLVFYKNLVDYDHADFIIAITANRLP